MIRAYPGPTRSHRGNDEIGSQREEKMKKTERGMLAVFSVLFCVAASSQFAFPEVYKWVDEKGVIHFTES